MQNFWQVGVATMALFALGCFYLVGGSLSGESPARLPVDAGNGDAYHGSC